jgi:hypothetical protein
MMFVTIRAEEDLITSIASSLFRKTLEAQVQPIVTGCVNSVKKYVTPSGITSSMQKQTAALMASACSQPEHFDKLQFAMGTYDSLLGALGEIFGGLRIEDLQYLKRVRAFRKCKILSEMLDVYLPHRIQTGFTGNKYLTWCATGQPGSGKSSCGQLVTYALQVINQHIAPEHCKIKQILISGAFFMSFSKPAEALQEFVDIVNDYIAQGYIVYVYIDEGGPLLQKRTEHNAELNILYTFLSSASTYVQAHPGRLIFMVTCNDNKFDPAMYRRMQQSDVYAKPSNESIKRALRTKLHQEFIQRNNYLAKDVAQQKLSAILDHPLFDKLADVLIESHKGLVFGEVDNIAKCTVDLFHTSAAFVNATPIVALFLAFMSSICKLQVMEVNLKSNGLLQVVEGICDHIAESLQVAGLEVDFYKMYTLFYQPHDIGDYQKTKQEFVKVAAALQSK